MEDKLIEYSTAKLAKEKGFNITNRNSYDENTGLMLPLDTYGHCYTLEGTCPAPTQSLLQKWLRDKYEIIICIIFELDSYEILIDNKHNTGSFQVGNVYKTYEEALEVGLQEALKLI